ncbi:LacI family DNA-binding transcriptional regulator [Devosia rhodophyticola]|uniref:LacI family DNA-binding transcriptional regulator n=1 Tax=Devosia rhodophyticola TaxID=3026423 RepID=A0ABY7YYR9_9HYPH|nr:LacI family DNA-binding transcriptional regulator [Devosia rhodophyticola]WDR06160.1 LacI family DNA-binding transcriptional regulator [Devosia rhodophyticola]
MEVTSRAKKPSRSATIVEVATAANVSIGTVSRYINGLSVRKPEQIRAAIEELGYFRNALAGSIRSRATKTVGILVPNFDEFHARILAGTANHLRQAGYSALTVTYADTANSLSEAVDFLVGHRVDGLIVGNLSAENKSLAKVFQTGMPMAFYNTHPDGWSVDRVEVENCDVTTRAMEHLIDIGHTHIGIVTGTIGQRPHDERLRGYRNAHINAGLPIDPALQQPGNGTRREGYEAANRLMSASPQPTAIFSSNYQMTIGVLQLLRERNIRIPDDISLISFDDVDLFALLDPGITVIAQPLADIAKEVTRVMLERLSAQQMVPPVSVRLDCNIVLRGSTRPPKKAD